jgi:hypothetical protein
MSGHDIQSLLAVFLFAASTTALAEAVPDERLNADQGSESGTTVLELDQTVISGNQELPKVLYILPWREPQGLPDIEIQAEFHEADVFRTLYPPAYRRELGYFEALSALKKNTDAKQED